MLRIALDLSDVNSTYEDIASKFFEHFLYIADAINHHEALVCGTKRMAFTTTACGLERNATFCFGCDLSLD